MASKDTFTIAGERSELPHRGDAVTMPARTRSQFRLVSMPAHLWLAVFTVMGLGTSTALVIRARRARRRWPEPVSASNAVGDQACLSCHREKASFERTAHRLTMRPPTRDALIGSFRPGENVLRVEGTDMHFRMDADSTGFYQSLVTGTGPDSTSRTERVAFVAGSGRKGQSFLYWSGDRLMQLPVSHWTALDRWIGSPGRARIEASASFNRGVAPRCLECHATWIEPIPDLQLDNRYRADSAIIGITCERCHGSGQEHVTRERSFFRHVGRGPGIVNPARLSRDRTMDACAQCHGGPGDPRAPPFTYVAGRRLEDYLHLIPRAADEAVDVHANQVALLERSRCYQSSQMTCITCHDVHRPQRDTQEISGRCLTCHQPQSCPLFATRGAAAIKGRCVDCHMPLETSHLVVSDLEGQLMRVQGRSHWIRVYPETAGH